MITLPGGLVSNLINEVVNGFRVPVPEKEKLANYRDEMKRIFLYAGASVDPDRDIVFSGHDEEIMRWALRLTLEDLGLQEFATRTGYDFELVKRYSKRVTEGRLRWEH